ncbi:MAG TPA: transposase [Planctomycetota bacterium]|nr:transposase [Planctomycetota bacterium]
MARRPRTATLWEVPDPLWDRIQPLLDTVDAPHSTGRPRVDRRRALDGIIFHLRTGCPWNHIPRVFGDDSTIHRYFRNWNNLGIFERIWSLIVEECQELGALDWSVQAPRISRAGERVEAVG